MQHIPRINGEIPSIDEATSDHQLLLDRSLQHCSVSYLKYMCLAMLLYLSKLSLFSGLFLSQLHNEIISLELMYFLTFCFSQLRTLENLLLSRYYFNDSTRFCSTHLFVIHYLLAVVIG